MEENESKIQDMENMIKQVTVDIEYCDYCKENEAYKPSSGITITCDCCGKVLCEKCRSYVLGISVCPACKQEKFKRYFEIIEKMDELEKQSEVLRTEYEEEVKSIVEGRGN